MGEVQLLNSSHAEDLLGDVGQLTIGKIQLLLVASFGVTKKNRQFSHDFDF